MVLKKIKNIVLIFATYFCEKKILYLTAKDWLKLGKNVHSQLDRPTLLTKKGHRDRMGHAVGHGEL